MDETERRRENSGRLTTRPTASCRRPSVKDVREILEISKRRGRRAARRKGKPKTLTDARAGRRRSAKLEKEMKEASKMLEFEYAAVLRDRIIELRKEQK